LLPAGIAAGIHILITPDVVLVSVPIVVPPAAKLPLASDNCAVNILPALNDPLAESYTAVYGRL
jgi:hypothetical protein